MILLEFILIFFALIFLFRRLAPWILRFFMIRLFKKVQEQQTEQQKQSKSTTNPNKTKKSSDDLGEYIDYEEID